MVFYIISLLHKYEKLSSLATYFGFTLNYSFVLGQWWMGAILSSFFG